MAILLYMETTLGPLGFTIPVQSLSSSHEVKMTPDDIMVWRNHLPMADLGTTAKKVYHAISDCNKVNLGLKERFEILELLRTPVQFISQSLRKHYMNQSSSLTKQQLTIANLAETLQLEMAMGYKLIVEQLENNTNTELRNTILPIALQRIIHYFTHILIRGYQLYTLAPKGVWKELHLVYRHAEKNHLLKQNNLQDDYKRILLLAATYPYQWRQNEQDLLYSATESWITFANLRDARPDKSKPGLLAIDLNEDKPPMSPFRGQIAMTSTCQSLDLEPLLEHIKQLLKTIEPNELQAKIAHHNEPEFVVSTSVLNGLIREWEKSKPRVEERKELSQPVNIALGLTATHFFVNNQKPFQSTQGGEPQESMGLPTTGLGLQEVASYTETTEIDFSKVSLSATAVAGTSLYQMYPCTLVNQTSEGYGLLWSTDTYPAIQAGDVMGIEREVEGKKVWEVCAIRWLLHPNPNELRMGVESLAKNAKAGSAQLIKNGIPAGYYLRCLLLGSTILVPILPFKSGSQISILLDDETTLMEVDVTQLVDSSGSYKRFKFNKKETTIQKPPSSSQKPPETPGTPGTKEEPDNKGPDTFDSIWSNL